MIRKTYSFLNATPRDLRRPLFPVPEDTFASDDQVAERHEQEIRSPAVDRAIGDWTAAKEQGDESGLRAAAKSIVHATSAAFRLRGVPAYAHPVLPPQFVKAEAAAMAHLPRDHQKAIVSALLDKFDPSAKPGGTQQFVTQLAASAASPTKGLVRAQASEGPQADRSAPGGPQPKFQRNDPQPRWERAPSEEVPGTYNFRMRAPHEGWFVIDETGSRRYYNPDSDIFVDNAPDDDNDGRPDGLQIEPWRGY
jgi:hypothetical protein